MTSQEEQTAARLMALAQGGDALAYSDLLVMLDRAARRFARGRAGDVPWVDDVAQETLLTVHRVRHTYDPQRPFAPWFYAIASSRLVDVIRKTRRVAAREVAADILPERPAPATPADRDDVTRVTASVDALPARQRDIVRSLKIQDESVRDVSRRLGMSESAVKVAAHRAYRTLRRMLRSDDDD